MPWLRQLFRRSKPLIPALLWENCVARLPFLYRLSGTETARLKAVCETLLDRKTFTGAAGFAMTDEIAVLIAAQAALPVLNLTPDLYDDMAGVIVYPAGFVIPQSEIDEAGVVHEWRAPVAGEAVDAGGAVILSWEDVQQSDTAGYNVVIHEFAHKIDMRDGRANGCPPFLTQYHQDIDPRQWQHAFADAYRDFGQKIDHLDTHPPGGFEDRDAPHAVRHDGLFDSLPLDPYAASHPAEFFAVASEVFFVQPQPLADAYPEVFRLLAMYYRQDPLGLASKKAMEKHL
jgi:Mlc titration factor MtfA (ptsG expression regulator)